MDERYPISFQDWPRSRNNDVGPVLQSPDDESTLWVGSRGELYKFNKEDGLLKTYYHHPDEVAPDNHDPIGQQIVSLYISRSGTFWIGNRRGVFTFDRTKPTGSGTGLGLSVSYDIVVQGHGGELAVESEEGEGAVFNIVLPC